MIGMLILAHQRMRSVLMHRMQLAWKRLSASLWKAWRHRNVVDLMTCSILGICAFDDAYIPKIELDILSIEQNIDIPKI